MDLIYRQQAEAIHSAIRNKRIDILNSGGCCDFIEYLLREAAKEREEEWAGGYKRIRQECDALQARVDDLMALLSHLATAAKIELTAGQLLSKWRNAANNARKKQKAADASLAKLRKEQEECPTSGS